MLRWTERAVGLRLGRMARADLSQRLAHANSAAKMASPSGITTNAGPGRTIKAMPNASTVPPTTATKMRLKRIIVVLLTIWVRLLGFDFIRLSPNDDRKV